MGRDIHIRVTKYDENDNLYHEIALFRTPTQYEKKYNKSDELIKASPYSGRHSEMFDGMIHGDEIDGYGIFPWCGVKWNSYEENFRNEIKEKTDITGYYDFHEISLAEMKAYVLEHPFVVDYDADEEEWDPKNKPLKPNPIGELFKNIMQYVNFCEDLWITGSLTDYKVVFYFDC